MFEITWRVKLSNSYKPIMRDTYCTLLGTHKAQTREEAELYFQRKEPNLEILKIRWIGVCQKARYEGGNYDLHEDLSPNTH